MNIFLRRTILSVLLLVLLFTSCTEVDHLQLAKDRFTSSKYISYTTEALFPIPDSELVNTVYVDSELLFNETDSVGYEFTQQTQGLDRMYKNGEYKVVNHKLRMNRVLLPKHFKTKEQFTQGVQNSFVYKKWAPMNLLKQDWSLKGDTLFNDTRFKNYFRIDDERRFQGRDIRTELHIFISETGLLERFERRNFNDGNLVQRVVFNYRDYKIDKEKGQIQYKIPPGYQTTFGKEKKGDELKVGDKAPVFSAQTMDQTSINNADFKGKKYLLNFSVISCGNCKMTLDYINQKEFILRDDIPMLYINPEDDAERLATYQKSIPIPFPVIAGAEEIGQKFRINSYPQFFLIDEKGYIEKIQKGYSEEFLNQFKK